MSVLSCPVPEPMHYYTLFDQLIVADMALPELDAAAPAEGGIRVRRAELDPEQRPQEWVQVWNEGFSSLARTSSGYWLYFEGMADFAINSERTELVYSCIESLPDASLRHLLLDNVLPMVLGDSGNLILHASAVVLPNGQAVMFSGDSGAGKSTLASYCYTQGAKLLTDDCLLLRQREGRLYCVPNYHGVRLFADSEQGVLQSAYASAEVSHYSSKRRQAISRPEGEASAVETPLAAIFMIDRPEQAIERISLEPIQGASSVASMLAQVFSLDPADRSVAGNRFAQIGALCRTTAGIYRLHYPRDYSALPDVYQKISRAQAP
ncbi:MAG: hypothetical protein V7744_19685 [Pseudomonadales bacterium]